DRKHVLRQDGPASHPLIVVAPRVAVGTIEAGSREDILQPAEDRLVADVHAKRYLGVLTVAPEVSLADEQAGDEPALEVGQGSLRLWEHRLIVSPSRQT